MMNFLYTNHTKHIELDNLNTSVDLWFFGDVHRDTSACDDDRWEQFLKKAKKSENAYYIGMGDYHDFASSSEKKSLRHANLHETTMEKLDEVVMKMNRKFAGEIGFMRDRLLCLVEGNHNWVFPNGQTSTDDLASRMGTINVGWLSHYTLLFDFKNRPTQTIAVRMVLCHGKAGGKTAGITITQVDDMKRIFPVADLYIQGHDHQLGAWPVSVLVPNWKNEIKQKRQLLCRSGSFKKTYEHNKSSYEVGKLFKPADLGALKLTVTFNRNRKDGADTVNHYIEATI